MESLQRLMLITVVATAVRSGRAAPASEGGVVMGIDDEDDELVDKRDEDEDDEGKEVRNIPYKVDYVDKSKDKGQCHTHSCRF